MSGIRADSRPAVVFLSDRPEWLLPSHALSQGVPGGNKPRGPPGNELQQRLGGGECGVPGSARLNLFWVPISPQRVIYQEWKFSRKIASRKWVRKRKSPGSIEA